MRIKKGDLVEVISGKDKGKRGKVLRVIPKENKVIVENVNMVKRHQRPVPQLREGGIIEREAPIYASKVMVVCPACDKRTRVGYRFTEDGKKVRYCKKCGEIIDKD
ncbi:50S ribosomal protein L24 [Thermotoga maritima MSB8]|uniref:Large ribosomal subunit protein uL24 n=1 Tax=Thermotoga maritima (strain ATCC 43589 / DSM 3109 / JCM 10099 / NBRC 100826 / MSB8) TaxID=243274 RepID=RL24_THEMA|nr:50S ribosomal protein L24 [Thermotoga maritima]P38513.1 RecName: Full=Large ribosomal subunit protein uL24; AltName: Full=50S ribosomal protein L24 [Thermotoga maritima MSB8]AAD36555.1 ribosomal protein L24 [Thermotoga maritima MSB8]AGL50421.1 LSU ribosomal protein L24p (L26e) [Thermotoga maritima MSB8]AHD18616.1 50S ribosomal protein L24 [Thermotoga maritima MSB8]AKE27377.1 50S ribosomal protein L24 [Thermotoga maritima]AKE29249.1 50S ribosomal protein L24 [Thermotoga maritima MSB8]